MKRPETLIRHALCQVGNQRFVRNRCVRIWPGPPRFSWIVSCASMNAEDVFGLCVPGLKLRVGEGPRRGNSIAEVDFLEVPFAKARHRCAVELGMAADEVILAGNEASAGFGLPLLLGTIPALNKYRLGTRVLRFRWKARPSFEDKDACTGSR